MALNPRRWQSGAALFPEKLPVAVKKPQKHPEKQKWQTARKRCLPFCYVVSVCVSIRTAYFKNIFTAGEASTRE